MNVFARAETRRLLARSLAALILLGAALAATAVAIVSYHNLRLAGERLAGVFDAQELQADDAGNRGAASHAAEAEDPGRGAREDAPAWVRPLLQDLSMISPALVLATTLCLAWGGFQLVGKQVDGATLRARRFPFPTPYRAFYVNMGLLGTIVGFLIAFTNIDPRAEGQSQALVQALGTALWSTLSAIVLAYLVGPLIEVGFRGLSWLHTGERMTRGPVDVVLRLERKASATVDAFDAMAESVRKATGELDAQGLGLRLSEIESMVRDLARRVPPLEDATGTLREKLGTRTDAALSRALEAKKAAQSTATEVTRLSKRLERQRRRLQRSFR